MTSESLFELLQARSLAGRSQILTSVSFNLTIAGRDCPISDAAAKKRPAGLNELQHTLLGQIGHYLDEEEVKVYPLDVFCTILFQKAVTLNLLPDLVTAIKFAMRVTLK